MRVYTDCQPSAMQRVSEALNGIAGEATNDDDLAKNNKVRVKDGISARDLEKILRATAQLRLQPQQTSRKPAVAGNRKKLRQTSRRMAHHEVVLSRMMNPHDRAAPLRGLPKNPTTPSLKARGIIDFTMVVGSASGFGYCSFNPSVASNNNQVIYTAVDTSVSSAIAALGTPGTGEAQAAASGLPYASSSLNAQDLQARIISAGATIEYIGRADAEAGYIYAFADPHSANVTSDTEATWSSRRGVIKSPVKKGVPQHISFLPNLTSQSEYAAVGYQWNTSSTSTIGGFMCVGCDPTAKFRVQYTIDVEYMGTTVDLMASPNPPATHAWDTVLSAAQMAHTVHVANPKITPQALATHAVKFLSSKGGQRDLAMASTFLL
jgi:hypothetical protein